ncbi:MAG: hypothetical protein A2Y02_01505 [Omnitrophica bacterium GWA2_52_12]|nr:MAG: hypothetical protein A2Y02_01505 [Omnitrophica bacterium GWA2_52_12]
MKKFTNYLFIFFVLSLGSFILPIRSDASLALPSFQNLASNLSSPDAIAQFIWRNFQVESDQVQFGTEDRWQSPEELLKSGRGDCEDFALFAYELLKAQGTQAYMLNIYSRGAGHTVAIFREGQAYHAIDGTQVVRGGHSLEDLISKISPYWKSAALVKAVKGSGHGMILKKIIRS